MNFELAIIDFQSKYYQDVLILRNKILRIPLGMNLFDEDLDEDKDQYIVVALENENIIGCLMLIILDAKTVKFRQMAVDDTCQLNGVGTMIIRYAENFCVLNDYTFIELHSRISAKNFYLKNGYIALVDEFEEVGIPHVKMVKSLIY